MRHGESTGNTARTAARKAGQERVDLPGRDMEVPLSPVGEQQADALGRWFASLPEAERPNLVLLSPYGRVRDTAQRVAAAGGLAAGIPAPITDERLREKGFGMLERLTPDGIAAHHPEEADRRHAVGKFYYRPPGGESWCDVVLRLRGVLDMLCLHHPGRRVLVIGHRVTVMCLRYLLGGLDEAAILDVDKQTPVQNGSVTEFRRDPDPSAAAPMTLVRASFVPPGAPETNPE